MVAPIAPGPAIKGVASGNTEMSSFSTASAVSSLVVVVPPEGRPNTMSIAISSRSMPPAMRSAGREMPNSRSTASPNSANTSRMAVAITVP
jgi:hypothetical protein